MATARGPAARATGGPARPAADVDRQILGIARGSGLNLLGQVCSQLVSLGITVLLARQLGRADVGRYALAFAFLSLLGLLSLSGFRAGLTRFVAVHLADGDGGALRGTVRLGLGLSTGAAALLGAGLYLAARWLAHGVFQDPSLALPLEAAALVLPAATFTDSALAATQGWRTMRPFALIGLVFEPLARIALTVALVATGGGLRGAMLALVASQLAAAALAATALRRLLRGALAPPVAAPTYNLRELLGFSTVSWMASLASTGLVWADTLMLGIFLPSAEVGVYNVATRLVTLATFVMPAVNAALGARIADLYHRGETGSLARAYGVATSWVLRLSLPSFVALLAFPRELLALFGDGFEVAATVTIVLAAGKLIDATTGPCGLMLNMSGRPLWNMVDNLAVLALNVALNLVLIPRQGILGAAVAWAVALAVVNLARVAQVRHALRMLPFDLGVAKGLLAGAGALVVALLARHLLAPGSPLGPPLGPSPGASLGPSGLAPVLPPGPSLAATAFGLALVGAVYLGLVAALGISPEDRLVLHAALRRLRPTRTGAAP